MTTTAATARAISYRRLLRGALLAAAAATLLNTLLYFAGRVFGAFPPTLLVRGAPFSVVPVILFSFFPGLYLCFKGLAERAAEMVVTPYPVL